MRKLFVYPVNTDLGILLLRFILGGLFFWHGFDALQHYKEYLGYSKSNIGLDPKLEFDLAVYSYFFCGIFIVVGFLTRFAVIPILIAMSVALMTVHRDHSFTMKELPFVYWVLCFPVLVFGSGRYSVDNIIFRK